MAQTWGKPLTPPLNILCAWPQGQHLNVILSQDSQILKFLKLWLLQLWKLITSCTNFQLKWVLKQSFNPRLKLSNDVWHVTCMWINQGNSQLLVVESQINNLIPSPSFSHNLCFQCPNESCKPILDIYIPRTFQWYKKLFNPMNFDPCNYTLKIWKSIIPTPKMKVHLEGGGGSFPHTFLHSREHEIWVPSFTFGSHLHKPLL
jgi:hypothetical protein